MIPISKAELAAKYRVSRKTFISWCKKIGIDLGVSKMIMPNQLKIIYEKLGKPE